MNLRWSKTFGRQAGSNAIVGLNLLYWALPLSIGGRTHTVTYSKTPTGYYRSISVGILCFSITITYAEIKTTKIW
jgi:hypothetical protein